MLAATGAVPDAALSQAGRRWRDCLALRSQPRPVDPPSVTPRAQWLCLLLTAGGPVVAFPGSQRVAIRLLDSNPRPHRSLDPLPSHTDYSLAAGIAGTPASPTTRACAMAVYPGIDVVYYGNPAG